MSGPYSLPNISPIKSGTVPVTELQNILTTNWAKNSLDNISTLNPSLTNTSCPTSNGVFNQSDSSISNVVTNLNMAGLGQIMETSSTSIRGVQGDLHVAITMQSIASGLAHSLSSTTAGVSSLISLAIDNPSEAPNLVKLASRVMKSSANLTDLSASAFTMAGRGQIMNSAPYHPGELMSGQLYNYHDLFGNNLGEGVGPIFDLSIDSNVLRANLSSYGLNIMIPPNLSVSQLSNIFPPIAGINPIISQGLGVMLNQLAQTSTGQIALKIASVLNNLIPTLTGQPHSLTSYIETRQRIQGLYLLDGLQAKVPLTLRSSTVYRMATNTLTNYLPSSGKSALGLFNSTTNLTRNNIAIATMLGIQPPVSGAFLPMANGYNGSLSSVLENTALTLAETCAFNTALDAILMNFPFNSLALLEELLAALQCRTSTYHKLYLNSHFSFNYNRMLLGLVTSLLSSLENGIYETLCPSSNYNKGY
jgi:hypothetical protein